MFSEEEAFKIAHRNRSDFCDLRLRCPSRTPEIAAIFIDLLMGLFRGAVFRHGGGALKQPIKQATENADQHHGLNGPFPLLNGPFSDLNGAFP